MFFDEGQIRQFFVSGVDPVDSDIWLFSQSPFTDANNVVHGTKYGPDVVYGADDDTAAAQGPGWSEMHLALLREIRDAAEALKA